MKEILKKREEEVERDCSVMIVSVPLMTCTGAASA